MRLTALAFAGVTVAFSPTLKPGLDNRPDLSGSYWDATISAQSGRPGYSIRDLTVSFHQAGVEQTVGGTCHYSFVPQGTSPPATTDRCDTGLSYTWDYDRVGKCSTNLSRANASTDTTLNLRQNVLIGNETYIFFGNAKIETTHRSDGAGGSSTKGSGRVEISHYCNDGGCSDPDGCATCVDRN